MSAELDTADLARLVRTVFRPRPEDGGLALVVDLPDERLADNDRWRTRRAIAAGWHRALERGRSGLGLDEIALVLYRNVRRNNADLPAEVWRVSLDGDADPAALLPSRADALDPSRAEAFDEAVFEVAGALKAPLRLTLLLEDVEVVEQTSRLLRSSLLRRARRSFHTVAGDAAVVEAGRRFGLTPGRTSLVWKVSLLP